MPTYRTGEMFDEPGIPIATSSTFISAAGAVVMNMGAGFVTKLLHPCGADDRECMIGRSLLYLYARLTA